MRPACKLPWAFGNAARIIVFWKEASTVRCLLFVVATLVELAIAPRSILAADTPPSAESKPAEAVAPAKLDNGDTAWMLISTGLVLLMVPGLALFYGGMVRRKNVLGTMMHSMVALALIGIQWMLFGYCLAFGDSHAGLIGWTTDFLGLNGVLS